MINNPCSREFQAFVKCWTFSRVIAQDFKGSRSRWTPCCIWAKYLRMGKIKFVEDSLQKIWSNMVCLGRSHHFKFFKGCLSHILLGPFLNTLSRIWDMIQNQDTTKKSVMIFVKMRELDRTINPKFGKSAPSEQLLKFKNHWGPLTVFELCS